MPMKNQKSAMLGIGSRITCTHGTVLKSNSTIHLASVIQLFYLLNKAVADTKRIQ